MRRRGYDIVSLVLLGITLFFLILTVMFSTGSSIDFKGIPVTAVLTVGGIFTGASLFFARPSGNLAKRIGFYMTHAGIVLLLAGFALFEIGGDSVTATVPVSSDVNVYYSNIQRESGEICDLGFNFCVENFEVETYEDGSDKQYTADLLFADEVTLKVEKAELSVNHTVRRNGWKIYLMSYGDDYINLLFRCDPGEYVVKAGVVLLIAGTVTELLIANVRAKKEDGND